MDLCRQVKAARRAGTPLLAISTPDAAATIAEIVAAINGDSPKLAWDCVQSYKPLNESGAAAMSALNLEKAEFGPHMAMVEAENLPERSVVFVHNAHMFMGDPLFKQAVWNLRDKFKQNNRTLILLGSGIVLPPELAGSTTVLDEPLPNEQQIAIIVDDVTKLAGVELTPEQMDKAVHSLAGLPAFQVEQATAESLEFSNEQPMLDQDGLWERKRRLVEQTPGLTIYRGSDKFDSIGGCQSVKEFLSAILNGRYCPRAVVWVDEIEKALAGAKGDTSGVSQDQLATLLGYIEDHNHIGMILNGPPGTAKSALAKAAGCEAGIPTIRLDLGGTKGSLVGQSEQQLRAALKVITAVSNDKALWIATSNSVANMDTAMLRRMPDIFYCDLPDAEERAAIWAIWKDRYGLHDDSTLPDSDDGWVGANIRKACEKAWMLGCTVSAASRYVVPVGKTAAGEIATLRKQAEGRYLSARFPGVYSQGVGYQQPAGRRQLS